jgi:hypothetical protein
MPAKDQPFRFQGFHSPNYTQVPDQLFDELLGILSGAELKVLLYIIRRTFGFKRDTDSISLSQMLNGLKTKDGRVLDAGAGVSKPTLLQALRSLEDKGIIATQRRRSLEKGDEPTIYRLRLAAPATGSTTAVRGEPQPDPTAQDKTRLSTTPVVKELDQGVVKEPDPPVVKGPTTQETVVQDTESSNIRKAAQGVDNSEPEHTGQSGLRTPVGDTPTDTTHAAANTLTNGKGSAAEEHKPTVLRTVSRAEHASSAPRSSNGQSHRQNSGPELLGAILTRHSLRPEEPDAREAIQSYIKDMAQEFGDKAKLKSSVSRAYNLYEQSGRTLHAFVDALFMARANVKERNTSTTQQPIQNRMSYFFSVLEDQLGLNTQHQGEGAGEPPAPAAGLKNPHNVVPPE